MWNMREQSFFHSCKGHTANQELVIWASWSDHTLLFLSPPSMPNVIWLCLNIHISENISETLASPWKTFFPSVVFNWYAIEVFSDFSFLWTLSWNRDVPSPAYRHVTLCHSIEGKSVLVEKAHTFLYSYQKMLYLRFKKLKILSLDLLSLQFWILFISLQDTTPAFWSCPARVASSLNQSMHDPLSLGFLPL